MADVYFAKHDIIPQVMIPQMPEVAMYVSFITDDIQYLGPNNEPQNFTEFIHSLYRKQTADCWDSPLGKT